MKRLLFEIPLQGSEVRDRVVKFLCIGGFHDVGHN